MEDQAGPWSGYEGRQDPAVLAQEDMDMFFHSLQDGAGGPAAASSYYANQRAAVHGYRPAPPRVPSGQVCRPHFHSPLHPWISDTAKAAAAAAAMVPHHGAAWCSPFPPAKPQPSPPTAPSHSSPHLFSFPPTPPKDATPDPAAAEAPGGGGYAACDDHKPGSMLTPLSSSGCGKREGASGGGSGSSSGGSGVSSRRELSLPFASLDQSTAPYFWNGSQALAAGPRSDISAFGVCGEARRNELCQLQDDHDDPLEAQPEWRTRLQRLRSLLQVAQREPAADDEEGGHPDAEPQAVLQEQEEERRSRGPGLGSAGLHQAPGQGLLQLLARGPPVRLVHDHDHEPLHAPGQYEHAHLHGGNLRHLAAHAHDHRVGAVQSRPGALHRRPGPRRLQQHGGRDGLAPTVAVPAGPPQRQQQQQRHQQRRPRRRCALRVREFSPAPRRRTIPTVVKTDEPISGA